MRQTNKHENRNNMWCTYCNTANTKDRRGHLHNGKDYKRVYREGYKPDKQINMKNPQNGEWYVLAINKDTHFVTVTWSKGGAASAWIGYSDTRLDHAGGYGYDKLSTVLSNAVANLTKDEEYRNRAGVGVNSLQNLVQQKGGKLYSRHEAIEMIYKDIATNDY